MVKKPSVENSAELCGDLFKTSICPALKFKRMDTETRLARKLFQTKLLKWNGIQHFASYTIWNQYCGTFAFKSRMISDKIVHSNFNIYGFVCSFVLTLNCFHTPYFHHFYPFVEHPALLATVDFSFCHVFRPRFYWSSHPLVLDSPACCSFLDVILPISSAVLAVLSFWCPGGTLNDTRLAFRPNIGFLIIQNFKWINS